MKKMARQSYKIDKGIEKNMRQKNCTPMQNT